MVSYRLIVVLAQSVHMAILKRSVGFVTIVIINYLKGIAAYVIKFYQLNFYPINLNQNKGVLSMWRRSTRRIADKKAK
jgi:hypothetical protein